VPAARQHNLETITEALMLLSYYGNLGKTVEALKQRGINVPRQTISGWRDKHADLWQQAETRMREEVLDRVADRAERYIIDAQDAEQTLLEQLMATREELPAKEVANALRNISVSKAIAMEKVVMPVRGRPTQIVEHIDLYATLNEMNRIAASLPPRPELELVTSTAVEDD
jgi:transposase-like protein